MPVDLVALSARVPDDLMARAWDLVRSGWHLEANRVLCQYLHDAIQAQALVAMLIKRKLRIHN